MSNLILFSLLISAPLIRLPHGLGIFSAPYTYAGAFPPFIPFFFLSAIFFLCRFYFVSLLAPFLTLCGLLFLRSLSVITIRANEWHIRLPLKQISISAIESRDYGESSSIYNLKRTNNLIKKYNEVFLLSLLVAPFIFF